MANNYCHLSYEDRKNIEDGLNENKSITKISKEINRNYSSIHREINRNKVFYRSKYGYSKDYEVDEEKFKCKRLEKPPYLCNGCKSRSGCRKDRWTYYARKADDEYRQVKSEARQGINLTEEEIFNINTTITPLIKKGQSVNHIYANHPELLFFSKTSFYNYVSGGIFEFKPSSLPRMVKYKKRNTKKRRTKEELKIRLGRTYDDFNNFINNNPDCNIVEMDTVEGLKTDKKCILTLFWRKSKFMLMFLLESQTASEVTRVFNYLQQIIPQEVYTKIFEVILTDNGHEFFDVLNIEFNQYIGEKMSHLFFCDSSASFQKGGIEKNHEFIRYVLPKKTTFENLNDISVNLIMNNINSLCRDSLNYKTPYEAMLFLCNENVLKLLECYYIKPDDVQLNKKLISNTVNREEKNNDK